MSSIDFTFEQKDVFDVVTNENCNILIEALAGTGKTTTISEISKIIPVDKSSIFLAYNKHIRDELKEKLPEHVKKMTTYGLGYSALFRKYPEIKFDEFKIDKIINKKLPSWNLHQEIHDYDEMKRYLSDIKKMVNHCRLTLTLKKENIPYLAERHDINLTKPEDIKRVLKILDYCVTDRTTHDYTDMIFLPAIDNSIWMFQYDYVFVDEVQDVNKCQIKIIEKIIKRDRRTGQPTGRLISVGDKNQCIYGFNSSDDRSFEWFRNYKNTKVLPLSYSFRCGKKIIEKAQEIVPNIKALDNAIDGIVRSGNVLTEAQSGDLILCRKTNPLIKLFFHFILERKKVHIKGSDIGENLLMLVGDNKNQPIIDFVNHWRNEIINMRTKVIAKGVLNPEEDTEFTIFEDKISTLIFIANLSRNINELIDNIKKIFTDNITDGIVLSTVHKSKGSEADRVFIVRKDLLPMRNVRGWQYGQEKNLEYVAYTRAKKELIFDYDWSDENE